MAVPAHHDAEWAAHSIYLAALKVADLKDVLRRSVA